MERGAEARLSMESQEAFFTLYWQRLVRFLLTQATNSSRADDVAGDTLTALGYAPEAAAGVAAAALAAASSATGEPRDEPSGEIPGGPT
jgi:hypothetical protein